MNYKSVYAAREDYLIVCNSLVHAHLLMERVARYLEAHYVTNMKVHKGALVITTTIPSVKIRFTSRAKADEATRGYHGIIRTGDEVDKFLDPWERDYTRGQLLDRFDEIL